MIRRRQMLIAAIAASLMTPAAAIAQAPTASLNELIAKHAKANGVPESLIHRICHEESRYHPRVVGGGGAMGLMQIKYTTARGLGYRGPASGLLDPDINLTWGVRYLAGAYRMAQGNAEVARVLYGTGY
ncbi:lytic transglycosylase domain-containing protein [Reyranella sp. CPCC 100927]|uniref:lytic transglycosylase domain-containing protein n=1 Tax=Reyranella sp. CPCC 100927 TaxID=2599616 RepID=UPI0011B4A602|nr:lytic transglycosylase domain-containing protein [Reyranella sp. CPCC 100927]TWT05078.1 lytic transglycosylase domain-containing protein [Reyranella sp. CPCC 100927]